MVCDSDDTDDTEPHGTTNVSEVTAILCNYMCVNIDTRYISICADILPAGIKSGICIMHKYSARNKLSIITILLMNVELIDAF